MDIILLEVEEGDEGPVQDALDRVGTDWLLRYVEHARSPTNVYTLNGPDECTSLYQPWMLEHLLAKNDHYVPCFLNPHVVFGITSIQTHLMERHGLTSHRVESLLNDDAYRLHDRLHEKDEKETG